MIALLLDQGLAPRAAMLLRQRTFEAVHVSEIGMADAEDVQILQAARSSGWICVTLEHDFHTHLAIAGQGHPSVILTPGGKIERGGGQYVIIYLTTPADFPSHN